MWVSSSHRRGPSHFGPGHMVTEGQQARPGLSAEVGTPQGEASASWRPREQASFLPATYSPWAWGRTEELPPLGSPARLTFGLWHPKTFGLFSVKSVAKLDRGLGFLASPYLPLKYLPAAMDSALDGFRPSPDRGLRCQPFQQRGHSSPPRRAPQRWATC